MDIENKTTNELHPLVLNDITDRASWGERQATWYQMRNHGLRRRNKPWPGAADMHFPLCDSMIDKWKPFYFQQLFATEVVASFVSKDRTHESFTSELEYHFDYKLKEQTNLAKAVLVAIDKMLCSGTEVVKTFWNAAEKRVEFDAIEPSRCIVPWHTKELACADRVAHVIELSVPQYKANANYRQDAEFVKKITGKGSAGDTSSELLDQAKQLREGLTCSSSDSLILIWEVWERVAGVNGKATYQVHTWSPLAPDDPVRSTFSNPYDHGRLPFVRFDHEMKDLGHYDSRGIPEIAGPFETSLTKMWNEKHDFMSFCNRPMFYSEREIPNTANIRMIPGQILGFPIQRVDIGAPPISFDQEMISTRMVAEYRVGMPDFGIGQDINTTERKTATEVQRIGGLLNQGVDLRAQMFRMTLAELFQQAWALLLQFDRSTQYVRDGAMNDLPKEALADAYAVRPKGSSDSWNRQAKLQKAVARKQLLGQSAFINQAELDKSILELDDPKLVQRLFQDPQEKQRDEYEDEATLVPTLMLGMPLAPKPGQDRVARIKCLVDFIDQRGKIGAAPDPVAMKGIEARIAAQLQALGQENPKLARKVQGELQAIANANAHAPQTAEAGAPPAEMPAPVV